ncbi:hypothetical protein BHF71_05650 [Vulcanibacillus modesticaldus]|uniref:histidine kinase n=1 Tax=Vulcanibacillus modesticaldus TaxID=337097 RepID=A0A1D2YX68_9BACI|nr:PAS domain S-box protein [Vulcanibacillus modesticaldus]OEG00260.1 hypothetical protein BHF71_05650 [Vulcanibacillus modesticaldus]
MKEGLNNHRIQMMILILIPMILIIAIFYIVQYTTLLSLKRQQEMHLADNFIKDQAFISRQLNSPPLILLQNRKAIEKQVKINELKGIDHLLIENSIDNFINQDVIGIYSLERDEIVFHLGSEEVYNDISQVDMDKLLEKTLTTKTFIKINDKLIYFLPIVDEGYLRGIIYTYNIRNVSITKLLSPLILSLILAIIGTKLIEGNIQKRIYQFKEDVDNLKETGAPLPAQAEPLDKLAQSVNDLQEHLYSEKKLLKILLDSLPLGVIFYNKDGKVNSINKTVTEITGFSQEEIDQFTVKGNILNSSENVFWETLRSGQSFLGFESYCPTKDGREIPVMTSTKPLYDSSNNFIGIVSSFIDISEQKRLAKVEMHSKIMLDHISDGVIRVDNNGVINGFNRGAELMTGFKTEEVLGKKYDDIFIKRKTMFTKLTYTLNTGKEYNYKKEIFTQDGKKIHLMITTKILRDEEGNQIGAMGIYKDITHLEELTYQIQRADKLAVVGELAAGTAHEIRNPLTSIKGFIQLLETQIEDKEKKRYISLILKEINNINEIIKEMLLLAKPSKPSKTVVSINQTINDIVSFMKSDAVLKNVEIFTDLKRDLPFIEVDERQIKQVFINIIRNALQAMKDGGELHIFSRLNEKKRMVEVIFVDQGEGIPPDRLQRIYEPFYTTKEDGTGLGLPVSYQIMKNHDGDIQIHSILGKGTTVTLYFSISGDNNVKNGGQ